MYGEYETESNDPREINFTEINEFVARNRIATGHPVYFMLVYDDRTPKQAGCCYTPADTRFTEPIKYHGDYTIMVKGLFRNKEKNIKAEPTNILRNPDYKIRDIVWFVKSKNFNINDFFPMLRSKV